MDTSRWQSSSRRIDKIADPRNHPDENGVSSAAPFHSANVGRPTALRSSAQYARRRIRLARTEIRETSEHSPRKSDGIRLPDTLPSHKSDLDSATIDLKQVALAALTEQLDGLKTEYNQLLDRQSMPAAAIYGITAMFALGVILILAGILWDLGGNATLAVAVGTIAVFSAGLLKICCEQAPAHQLQECRREIDSLTREVAGIQRELHSTAAQETPEASTFWRLELSALHHAREQYSYAKMRWADALHQQGLPAHLSPKRLLQRLRTPRFDSPQKNRRSEPSLERLREELGSELDFLHRWEVDAKQALDLPPDDDSYTLEALAGMLRQALNASLQGEAEQPDDRTANLQNELKTLKKRKASKLSQIGVSSITELKQRVRTARQREREMHESANARLRLSEQLSKLNDREEVKSLLEENSARELEVMRASLERRSASTSEKITSLRKELSTIDRRVAELLADKSSAEITLNIAQQEAQLARSSDRILADLVLQESLPEATATRATAVENSRLRLATRYISCNDSVARILYLSKR